MPKDETDAQVIDTTKTRTKINSNVDWTVMSTADVEARDRRHLREEAQSFALAFRAGHEHAAGFARALRHEGFAIVPLPERPPHVHHDQP